MSSSPLPRAGAACAARRGVRAPPVLSLTRAAAPRPRAAPQLDITLPHMACSVLSLDVMDVSGNEQLDVSHNMFKARTRRTASGVAQQRGLRRCMAAPHAPADTPALRSGGLIRTGGRTWRARSGLTWGMTRLTAWLR